MKQIIINKNDAGQRVDKFLAKFLPDMPKSLIYKQLRKKRVKCGKKALKAEDILQAGDELFLYINDEFFETKKTAILKEVAPPVIVYEDEHILIADKPAGQPAHGGEDSLLYAIQSYLQKNGVYDPASEHSFAPALSNRLDRNTRGLVLAAKNAAALRLLNEKIKNGEIIKQYLAVINGHLDKKQGRFVDYLLADNRENRVHVVSQETPGAKKAVTDFEVLKEEKELSLLKITLPTGRKHQIRVQLAHAGHPLLGDTKYGAPRSALFHYQALCAHSLHFNFEAQDDALRQIAGKTIAIDAEAFFKKIY